MKKLILHDNYYNNYYNYNYYYTFYYSDVEFCNGDCMLPVYQWTRSKEQYPLEKLAKIILTNVSSSKLCSKQPVHVNKNVSFVVKLDMLDDPMDVRADENGVWKRNGSPIAYVSMHTNARKTKFFRWHKMKEKSNHYKITRTYYRHKSSPDFKRIITIAHGKAKKNLLGIVMLFFFLLFTSMLQITKEKLNH